MNKVNENVGSLSDCKKQLRAACQLTLKLTAEYQKSLTATSGDRKALLSEYYSFGLSLSECVATTDESAAAVSALISEADKNNDFEAKVDLGELLDKYVYYRANVQAFLRTTEEAKSSESFILTLKREADVLVRKTALTEREI